MIKMFTSARIKGRVSQRGDSFHPGSTKAVNKKHMNCHGNWKWMGTNYLSENLFRLLQKTCRASLVPSRPRRFRMWRHLSSLSGKFALGSNPPLVTRIARTGLGKRQVRTWVVKRITSLSNSFCSNVAKQVAHFCCPFYCSFKNKSAQKGQNRGTLMKRCPSAFTLPPSARKHSTRTLQSFFSNH